MKTLILKMTDAYEHQDFYENLANCEVVDCRGIQGTRCYLDEEACGELERIYENHPATLRFIDSGNYHYLSLLSAKTLQEPFNLILFDHHPDDQPPSFGDIISCGGWVLKAKEGVENLKEVFTFGVGDLPDVSSIPTELPVFVSIDKDVLCTGDAMTDWDQGDMTLCGMLELLGQIFENRRILAVDICGDAGENPGDACKINNNTNSVLVDFLGKYL